jgi:hypothetical protein
LYLLLELQGTYTCLQMVAICEVQLTASDGRGYIRIPRSASAWIGHD